MTLLRPTPAPATAPPTLAGFRTHIIRKFADTTSSLETAPGWRRARGATNWRAISACTGDGKGTLIVLVEVRLRHHPISTSPVPPQTTNPSVLIPSRRLPSLLVPQAVSPISTAHLLHIPSATLVSRLHSVPPGWPPFLVPLPGLGVSPCNLPLLK